MADYGIVDHRWSGNLVNGEGFNPRMRYNIAAAIVKRKDLTRLLLLLLLERAYSSAGYCVAGNVTFTFIFIIVSWGSDHKGTTLRHENNNGNNNDEIGDIID